MKKLKEIETSLKLFPGSHYESYLGMSICRSCSTHNGSGEFSLDNVFWPSGYSHYVEAHNIIPSKEFLEFIFSKEPLLKPGRTLPIKASQCIRFLPNASSEVSPNRVPEVFGFLPNESSEASRNRIPSRFSLESPTSMLRAEIADLLDVPVHRERLVSGTGSGFFCKSAKLNTDPENIESLQGHMKSAKF